MKTIYRVECSDGSGPYWTDDEEIHSLMYVYNGDAHPDPIDDKELARQIDENGIQIGRHIFAFESPEQLCQWFHDQETNYKLTSRSVTVVESHVNYFVKGNSQVMVPKTQYENRVVVKVSGLYKFVEFHKKELTPV